MPSVARKTSLAALEFNTCKHHQVPLVDRQNQTPQSQVSITLVTLTSFSSPPLESTSHPHLEASPDPNHTHIHTSPNHNTPSHNPYPSNPIHPTTSVTHCHNHIPHDQVRSIPSHNYQNQYSQPIHRTNLLLPNHRSSFFTINNKSNLRWSPPPPGHIKINFDAAWINETKLTGIGVLARDCHGSLIDGSSLLCLSGSPLEAEARPALTAVTLANKFHHVPIIFESDSKVLVDCISMNDSAQNWKIAPIISKINHSTTLNGRAVWLWVHREANSAADLVASLVVRKKCPVVWIDRPPSSLVGVLSRDGLPCPLKFNMRVDAPDSPRSRTSQFSSASLFFSFSCALFFVGCFFLVSSLFLGCFVFSVLFLLVWTLETISFWALLFTSLLVSFWPWASLMKS